MFANALMRKRSDKALQKAFNEIHVLKEQLEAENVYLRQQVRLFRNFEDIVGKSQAIQRVLRQVEQVAETDATVLIQGETGTGKELIANAIHRLSKQRERVMVRVNCAAIPQTLWKANFLAGRKAPLQGRHPEKSGVLKQRTKELFCWMRSLSFLFNFKVNYLGSFRIGLLNGLAVPKQLLSMFGSLQAQTRTLKKRSRKEAFAPIFTIV